MGEETQIERRMGTFLSDKFVKVFGGVIITALLLLSIWTLTMVINHEGRLIRQETKTESTENTLKEIKAGLSKLNDKMDKVLEQSKRP